MRIGCQLCHESEHAQSELTRVAQVPLSRADEGFSGGFQDDFTALL
jgi:hypothetical protein